MTRRLLIIIGIAIVAFALVKLLVLSLFWP